MSFFVDEVPSPGAVFATAKPIWRVLKRLYTLVVGVAEELTDSQFF
jgi:hypothetical protein